MSDEWKQRERIKRGKKQIEEEKKIEKEKFHKMDNIQGRQFRGEYREGGWDSNLRRPEREILGGER